MVQKVQMKHNKKTLPQIPNKRYFTIGEVGYLCSVKPHVLRYWEQEFPQLKPAKRRGNRRYYQREDVIMVRTIRGLLYDEGYTISGARIQLDNVIKQQRKANRASAENLAVKTETPIVNTQRPEQHEQNISYSVKFTVGKDNSEVTQTSASSKDDTRNRSRKDDANLAQQTKTPEKQMVESQFGHAAEDKKLKKYKFILSEVITELRDILAEIQDNNLERV